VCSLGSRLFIGSVSVTINTRSSDGVPKCLYQGLCIKQRVGLSRVLCAGVAGLGTGRGLHLQFGSAEGAMMMRHVTALDPLPWASPLFSLCTTHAVWGTTKPTPPFAAGKRYCPSSRPRGHPSRSPVAVRPSPSLAQHALGAIMEDKRDAPGLSGRSNTRKMVPRSIECTLQRTACAHILRPDRHFVVTLRCSNERFGDYSAPVHGHKRRTPPVGTSFAPMVVPSSIRLFLGTAQSHP
jgi:hypothetical protein